MRTPSPEPSPPPPPRLAGTLTLTSMLVRPSSTPTPASPSPPRRRDPSPSSPHFRRRLSPVRRSPPRIRGSSPPVRIRRSPPLTTGRMRRSSPVGMGRGRGRGRGRGSPTTGFGRRYSPPGIRRRGSPPGSFGARSERFKEEPGYGLRGISNSPPRRQRLDSARDISDFDRPVGPHFGGGFRGRGKPGRFRESSPLHGRGRGGRTFGRGYDAPGRSLSPVGDVRRHDPNISPREGDWICRNPSCGNLNFARRTYCSNCNQDRFGPEPSRYSRSPQRGYFNSPPPYRSPPRIPDPLVDRGRRNTNGYRSPLRLGAIDARDFRSGSPPRNGNGFSYQAQRERVAYRDDEYHERGKFYSPVHDEWDREDRQRDAPVRGRRGYEQRLRSPSPRDRWAHDSRERSRSPFGDRPLRGAYMGRGRAGRHFSDSYAGRGRGGDFDAGRGRASRRGRGFRRGDDGFLGEGRDDRPVTSRGRNTDMY